jgi:hypothetical protein
VTELSRLLARSLFFGTLGELQIALGYLQHLALGFLGSHMSGLGARFIGAISPVLRMIFEGHVFSKARAPPPSCASVHKDSIGREVRFRSC